MIDVFTPKKRSDVMSRIRSRGNRDTELLLAKLFRQNRITGWRRHLKLTIGTEKRSKNPVATKATERHIPKLVVRPDFVFPRSRLAVFVDGCFWHGCPKHSKLPANNHEFWKTKLENNKIRDKLVTRTLRSAGWRVIRIWEHDLAKKAGMCVQKVSLAIKPA